MAYIERVKNFEKLIAPYITGCSIGIEYAGCTCRIYHFISEGGMRSLKELGARKVYIMGTWGLKSLVVGMGWDTDAWHDPRGIKKAQEWAARNCPGMMEEPEWIIAGLKIKNRKK